MTDHKLPLIALCLAASLLGGCVAEDGFPSLAPRPAERDRSIEAPPRPVAQVPGDVALRQRVAELERQANAGDEAFEAAFGPAAAAVAAAGSRESEAWVDAQVALSRLEEARTMTTQALVDLDQLALGRAAVPTSEADFTAINAAIAAVERIADGQQQRLDRLRRRLSDG